MRQLGLKKSDEDDETAINNHIDNINFDLVILTEHFDEGIILLKRKLCWDFEDILYVKLRDSSKKKNGHSYNSKATNQSEKQEGLKTATMHDFYRDWSRADYILYNRMNYTFWQKYNKEPSIDKELLHFKKTRLKVEEFCTNALQHNKKGLRSENLQVVLSTLRNTSHYTLTIEKSKWNNVFTIDIFKCLLLKSGDNIMRDIFK